METCKNCIWFCEHKGTPGVGGCANFADKDLLATNSTVFDDLQKTKIPLVDVGENFGCIHWEQNVN